MVAVRAIVIFIAIGVIASAAAADDRVRDWPSPDGRARVWSVSVGSATEPSYQLRLGKIGDAGVVIDTFDRHVDVVWSPDGRHVAVTNWVGSNVADCTVIDSADWGHRVSMTAVLPTLSENAGNAHFYAACAAWEDAAHVRVVVSGHTDTAPSREFGHRLSYKIDRGQMGTP